MARNGFQGKARTATTRKVGEDGMIYARIAKDGNHNDLLEMYRAPYQPGMTHTGMGAVTCPELETESSYTVKYPAKTAEEYEKFCVDVATQRRKRKANAKINKDMESLDESSEVITTLGEAASLG